MSELVREYWWISTASTLVWLQVDSDRVFVPIALGISKSKYCRKGIERDVAVERIATEHLFTIKINDGPVVATQAEEADGRRGLAFADVESVPEISRRVLIVRIAAVKTTVISSPSP